MLQNFKNFIKYLNLHVKSYKVTGKYNDKQLTSFLSHAFNLDLNINTLIYLGRKKEFFRYLNRYFPNSNSFFMHSQSGSVILNLYSKSYLKELSQGFPLNERAPSREINELSPYFNIEGHCLNLNFKGPYFLYTDLYYELKDILDESGTILHDTEIIVISLNIEILKYHDSGFFKLQHSLNQYGFKLYDVINKEGIKEVNNGEKLFIFARKESRLFTSNRLSGSSKPNPENKICNCLIAGSGRSGTSMLGGILYEAGYYMGENLYIGNETNPKGFFESPMINNINEDILSKYSNVKSSYITNSNYGVLTDLLNINYLLNPNNQKDQGWLCSLPPELTIENEDAGIESRIEEVTNRGPFCYKDPRFSYTLPVWNKYLDDSTKIICVFRDPGTTVRSILKEHRQAEYLHDLKINETIAYEIYFNIYSHIIKNLGNNSNNITFIHYNQILNGTALSKLSELLNVKLTNSFADKNLQRSVKMGDVPDKVNSLYLQLCKLADYQN